MELRRFLLPLCFMAAACTANLQLEESLEELLNLSADILTEKPLFFLLNSYSTGLSPLTMRHALELSLKRKGYAPAFAEEGELALRSRDGMMLPCGGSVRITF